MVTPAKKRAPRAKATPTPVENPTPGCVVHIHDGTATITPIKAADVPAIAWLLLDAADDPAQVRTNTAPMGWVVPEKIAKAAGLT